jgi:hypothetical protein
MNNIVRHTGDGFDGFEDRIEYMDGEEHEAHRGLIEGKRLVFPNECVWGVKDNPNIPITTYDLVVVDILRVVQKWKDKKAETRILSPGELVPDIAALNAEVPDEEKELYQGKRVGPYQFVYVLYLLHEETVQKFTYIAGTIGAGIATRELADAVNWFRKYRGAGCLPRIRLERTWMPTRFGGRYRAAFTIVGWIKPTDGMAQQLPPREERKLEAPSEQTNVAPEQSKAPEQAKARAPYPSFDPSKADLKPMTPAQTVEPPSLREEMEDEVPY